MRLINKCFTLLLNTLFPPTCSFCKKDGDFLCKNCVHKIKLKNIGNSNVKNEDFKFLNGLIYTVDYNKNLVFKSALTQFKYKFTQELADYFSMIMNEKINQLSMAKGRQVILIPVPLHKKRLNERGFNQSQVLADSIAILRPQTSVCLLLSRLRYTKQQAKLTKYQRHENLKGAFQLNKNCVHKYNPKNLYFIVDDVCTTGSTIEACAEVLKNEGYRQVYGLVLARSFNKSKSQRSSLKGF